MIKNGFDRMKPVDLSVYHPFENLIDWHHIITSYIITSYPKWDTTQDLRLEDFQQQANCIDDPQISKYHSTSPCAQTYPRYVLFLSEGSRIRWLYLLDRIKILSENAQHPGRLKYIFIKCLPINSRRNPILACRFKCKAHHFPI